MGVHKSSQCQDCVRNGRHDTVPLWRAQWLPRRERYLPIHQWLPDRLEQPGAVHHYLDLGRLPDGYDRLVYRCGGVCRTVHGNGEGDREDVAQVFLMAYLNVPLSCVSSLLLVVFHCLAGQGLAKMEPQALPNFLVRDSYLQQVRSSFATFRYLLFQGQAR